MSVPATPSFANLGETIFATRARLGDVAVTLGVPQLTAPLVKIRTPYCSCSQGQTCAPPLYILGAQLYRTQPNAWWGQTMLHGHRIATAWPWSRLPHGCSSHDMLQQYDVATRLLQHGLVQALPIDAIRRVPGQTMLVLDGTWPQVA